MSALTDSVERRLAQRAGIYLAVQEDEEAGLVLSGMVGTEELRQAVLDIAREIAGAVAVVDDIAVVDVVPDEVAEASASARGERGFARLQRAGTGVSLEPGDFAGQRLVGTADEASGPERSLEGDEVASGDAVYVPAIDPPSERNEVVGGLELSSLDDVTVDASSDGTLGDEAIRDAVIRELREDAATAGLAVEVSVDEGLVRLTGRVTTLDDAESAEEVAARVPGVVEVAEELEVANLERSGERPE
jgi:osmotically-inducible protein OsmY